MSLYDVFCERNQAYLSRPAACQMMKTGALRTVTYQQMLDGINAYYEILSRAGYQPGDRIGICGAASPEWHMAFFAISRMGCTAACLDHSYPQEEMRRIAHKARLRGLYLTRETSAVLDDPMEGVNLYRLEDGQQTQAVPYQGETEFAHPEAEVLIFSSGTTSTAAGVLHTGQNAVDSIEMILHANGVDDDQQRFMAFLPNSHIYGCYAQCIAPALHGNSVCYLEELSAACIMGAFQTFHPTIYCGVPKVYELLLSSIQSKINASPVSRTLFRALFPLCLKLRQRTGLNLGKYLFSAVNKGIGGAADVMLCGGAPLKQETAEFLYGVGLRPIVTYGATETSIPTVGNYGKNLTTNTCGKPYPGVEMKLSETGELLLKPPYQMIGYFDDPVRTAEAYTEDGWFRTGDLASLDERGNLLIQGRSKENIVLATGKKVAPDDIEQHYAGIKGVKDFTVCGVPCGEEGSYDEVHCFVVLDGSLGGEQVEQEFQQRSADAPFNMKLHGIHMTGEIPRTALGKPKRFLLRKLLAEAPSVPPVTTNPVTIQEKVLFCVQKITGAEKVTPSDRLYHDLALDSLSAVELCAELEMLTGVGVDSYMTKEITVADLISLCEHPQPLPEKKTGEEYPLKHHLLDYPLMLLARSLIRLFYTVKVKGEAKLPSNSGYIICANHVSNFDYLYLTLNFPKERSNRLCCMAKQELFTGGTMSRILCRVAGMVPIDRGGLVSGAMGALHNMLQKQWGVLAFPEGTRSKDGKLSHFKHGPASLALKSGAPIIPACIKGGFEIYPTGKTLPRLFNLKTGRRYRVEVVYGDPIYPHGKNVEDLTQQIRQAVEELQDRAA